MNKTKASLEINREYLYIEASCRLKINLLDARILDDKIRVKCEVLEVIEKDPVFGSLGVGEVFEAFKVIWLSDPLSIGLWEILPISFFADFDITERSVI